MPPRKKIYRLPPKLRAQLERLLIDRTHGGYVALSAWLREQGYEIGSSTIFRHDKRLQAVMDRIRASTEAARMLANASPDDADDHSAAVLRIVQSSLFGVLSRVAEATEDADPAEQVRLLSQAARAVADVSRASVAQKRWADEVREKLDALERSASKNGKVLDAETLKAVREGLYGG